MKWIAAAVIGLTLATPATAQKTKTDLTNEIDTNLPDNISGLITPTIMRATLIDMVNSWLDLNAASVFACAANNFSTGFSSLSLPVCAQPTFGNLSGNIAVSQMNSGSGASSTTFWRGDGTWVASPGLGGVTVQKNTASGGLVTSGNCDNNTTNAASPCNYALTAGRQTLPTVSLATMTSHSGGFSANGSGTYSAPVNVLWLELKMVGGGGGGGGGDSAALAGNGGDTCWNTTGAACTTPVYNAGGGRGANNGTIGGAGGTAGGTSSCTMSFAGGQGNAGILNTSAGSAGGPGGQSSYAGGGGNSRGQTINGGAGVANSGGGGGGGGGSTGTIPGAGGGAGATCFVLITAPAATYTYNVGASGAGHAGAAGAADGGNGADGQIFIIEHYGS